jgi:hypothetical protein
MASRAMKDFSKVTVVSSSKRTQPLFGGDFFFDHRRFVQTKDLLALVETTGAADVMSENRLSAILADC